MEAAVLVLRLPLLCTGHPKALGYNKIERNANCLLDYKAIFSNFILGPQWEQWSSLSKCVRNSQGCFQFKTRVCKKDLVNNQNLNCSGLPSQYFPCNCPIGE